MINIVNIIASKNLANNQIYVLRDEDELPTGRFNASVHSNVDLSRIASQITSNYVKLDSDWINSILLDARVENSRTFLYYGCLIPHEVELKCGQWTSVFGQEQNELFEKFIQPIISTQN